MSHQWEYAIEVQNSFRDVRCSVSCYFYSEKAIHWEAFQVKGSSRSQNGIVILVNHKVALHTDRKEVAIAFVREKLNRVPPTTIEWFQQHGDMLLQSIG